MATIRDVAELAKVSIGTVSRVLSKDESFKVTDETYQSIQDAIQALNYTHQPKKKKKSSHEYSIGCLMSYSFSKYNDPFFARILSAIQNQCSATNCSNPVIFTNSLDGTIDQKTLERLRGFDGVIIMEDLSLDSQKALKTHIKNIVCIDSQIEGISTVGYDKYEANQQLINHLLNNNHRRIAYIGGDSINEPFYDSARMCVYRNALLKHNIEYDPSIIFNCKWDTDLCYEQILQLAEKIDTIDAIIAGSDTIASLILNVLPEKGIKIPEQVSVIGVNNDPNSKHTVPALTTVHLPAEEIGKFALNLLLEIIKNGSDSALKYYFNTYVVERNSTSRRQNR